MNWSAPPRSTNVQVLAVGQPSKKFTRSPPICRSSNIAHVPSCDSFISEQVDCIEAPVA